MIMADCYELHLPALEIRQGPRTLYSFAVDGKQLELFTAVARTRRDAHARLEGYQRPEVISHIESIRRYLESPAPLIPNALVVAFDASVWFKASNSRTSVGYARPGTLVVPVDESWSEEEKPGWLVDGQQRAAAIREAAVDAFPVCVTAFITPHVAEQRAQFILVNSTKPLPKSLLYELLPVTAGRLPEHLQRRQLAAALLERLNYDEDSPLQHRVRTITNPAGIIKDNSLLRALDNGISYGALFRFRDPATGRGDVEAMLGVLKAFWGAVRQVFPKAWELPPRRSRLVHGAGIISLGYLMDSIDHRHRQHRDATPTLDDFAAHLRLVTDVCAWTSGEWALPKGSRRWDEIQNTPKDTRLLSDYLTSQYDQRAPVPPTSRARNPRRSPLRG